MTSTTTDFLATGQRVIRREAGALDALAGALGASFSTAVGLLMAAKGRVIAVHAEDDQLVPLDQSSTYVRLATAAGGQAELVKVPGGHFDLIDTGSDAWKKIVELLP